MIKLSIKDIEKRLNKTIRQDSISVGFDTASTTGIAILETDKKSIKITTSIFKLPPTKKEEEFADKYVEKLEFMLRTVRDFKKTLKSNKQSILVLEQSYLGFFFNKQQIFANAVTFGLLRALQGIAFAELFDCFKKIKIPLAITARKEIGFKSQLKKGSKRDEKKKEIINWVNDILGTKETDDNICDAIILSIMGLVNE